MKGRQGLTLHQQGGTRPAIPVTRANKSPSKGTRGVDGPTSTFIFTRVMMAKLIINDLTELQCGNCGVWHAIPTAMYVSCRDEGGFWHCPNGHSRGWGTGTIQAERDRLKQKVAQLYDEVVDLLRACNN